MDELNFMIEWLKIILIEHSKNNIVMQNGLCNCFLSFLSLSCQIFADGMFLECYAAILRSKLFFKMHTNLILGMLY